MTANLIKMFAESLLVVWIVVSTKVTLHLSLFSNPSLYKVIGMLMCSAFNQSLVSQLGFPKYINPDSCFYGLVLRLQICIRKGKE